MGAELETEKEEFYDMGDVNFSDSELVCHVRDALRSVSSGDGDSYSQLVGVIHHTERLTTDEVALLVTSLKALSGAVVYIDFVHHEGLLFAIFGMNMWNHGPDVLDALVDLIISLAASNGRYVDPCLEMLLSNFRPPKTFLNILKQPRGIARKHHVLSRVHSALKQIADLVPLAPLRLSAIITQRMPNTFIAEPKDLIVIYVENLLRLEGGAFGEIVGSTVLNAVVDLLVDLDVEIEWVDILQDNSSKGVFQMELEELDRAADQSENDDELPREALICGNLGNNIVAGILDSLMVVTFEHLQSCDDGGRLIKVFETLLISFQSTVLPAYRSKFAQFLIFYACSLDPEKCGVRFPVMLADIFVCSSYHPDKRMTSVAYLASYLARGNFLPASLVISMLKRLVNWCIEYCRSKHGDINPTVHGVYYSACQAIMYVLCFRMRSMLDVPHLRSQLLLMPIELILKHPLNPLKVCLPSIVEEFLQQAKVARLFAVSETFVFNDLLELDLSRAFGGAKRLDTFFPFDPCLLKNCDRFIRPKYLYWSMVRRTCEDVDCSSDEDDVDDILDGVVRGPPHDEEYSTDVDEFECSVDKMSMTPKNYGFGSGVQALRQMPSRIRPSTSPESL